MLLPFYGGSGLNDEFLTFSINSPGVLRLDCPACTRPLTRDASKNCACSSCYFGYSNFYYLKAG